MTRITTAVEWRLVVPGHAVSLRSASDRRAYQKRLQALARRVFPHPPTRGRVEVFLDYFHTERRRVDMDNIAKCVLDGMNGHAYVDDRQVLHQYSRAYGLTQPFWLPGGPVDLIKPLARHTEYLFIRVRTADQGQASARRTPASSRRAARAADAGRSTSERPIDAATSEVRGQARSRHARP